MTALSETKTFFKKVLLEALDEGLSTIGESARKAIYFHLQNLYSLKREEIPDNPKAFVEGLRKIFGLGAEVIEKAVIKSLYSKLEIKFEERKGYGFIEYLTYAMQILESESG